MSEEILIGLIVGAVVSTTLYVYNSKKFSLPQKIYLYLCFVFPPLQWVSILAILFYIRKINKTHKEFDKDNGVNKATLNNIDSQKKNLESLKKKGILSESEYQNKIKIITDKENRIREANLLEELKKQDDYKSLEILFQDGILTQEEFNIKVSNLKENFKQQSHLKEKIIGKWANDKISFHFATDNNFKYTPNLSKINNFNLGRWKISGNKTIRLYFNNREEELHIIEISDKSISFEHNDTTFDLQAILIQ